MENSIATASVNYLDIKKRKYSDLAFRAIRKLAGKPNNTIRSILLYPEIDSQSVYADLRNRLGWYLPENHFEHVEIHFLGKKSNLSGEIAPEGQPYFPTDHLSFTFHSASEASSIASDVDRILVWDKNQRIDSVTLPNIGKVELVDKQYYSTVEPGTWLNISSEIQQIDQEKSRQNFRELEESVEDTEVSYVFGTGPSLDDVYDFEIPNDALSIICNSIVRDEDLLNHLQPDILVFADPVFHFGPSQYAEKFREDVVNMLQTYDSKVVIPKGKGGLFAAHYPEFDDRLIEIESVNSDVFVYPTRNRLEVTGTSNIMTLFMLPIAASLTNEVGIVGADGRKEDESYFWEHSDTGQYDDEFMETVVETHPSFFRDRIYEDYYDEHVKTLTELIEDSESRGVDIYSVTNSYIPALANRYKSPEEVS